MACPFGRHVGARRDGPQCNRGVLEVRLLADEIPAGDRQSIRRRRRALLRVIPVVEGDEDDTRFDPGQAGRDDDLAAPRADLDKLALVDPKPRAVHVGDLDECVGGRTVERRRTGRLCAGVEVVDDAARGQQERVLLVWLLGRGYVLRALDDRPALRVSSRVFGGFDGGTGHQIVAIGLAVLGGRVEDAIVVLAFLAVRVLLRAWPLDATRATQLLVGHGRVVARAATRALAPRVEGAFGVP